jgi:hypothetical protein
MQGKLVCFNWKQNTHADNWRYLYSRAFAVMLKLLTQPIFFRRMPAGLIPLHRSL